MLGNFFKRDKWGKRNIEKLFHFLNEGIVVQDKSGKIVDANEAVVKLIGLKNTQELIKLTSREVIKKFKITNEQGRLISWNQLPGTKAIKGKRVSAVVLRFTNSKTGLNRWVDVNASSVYNSFGKVVYAINIFRDVTDKKQKEQDTLFTNQLLQAQGEATTQGILAVTQNQKVIYVNSRLS